MYILMYIAAYVDVYWRVLGLQIERMLTAWLASLLLKPDDERDKTLNW
jgi:hypothetical protein